VHLNILNMKRNQTVAIEEISHQDFTEVSTVQHSTVQYSTEQSSSVQQYRLYIDAFISSVHLNILNMKRNQTVAIEEISHQDFIEVRGAL